MGGFCVTKEGAGLMLKTCSYCGRLHGFDECCPLREKQRQRYKEAYPRKYGRDSDADKFRSTKEWQRKRRQIRARDLNLCRVCFVNHHRIVTEGLSVHHIVPLEDDFSKRLSDGNLITLCRDCHEKAERGEISADELRSLVRRKMKI